MIKYLLIPLLLFPGCTIDSEKSVDRSRFTFKTGDDTELFFKNMRASYYEKEEKKEILWNIYRSPELYSDTSGYFINVAIIINVMDDEAYILVEPGVHLLNAENVVVYWEAAESNNTGEIILSARNKEGMLEFASQLYEAIEKNHNLFVKIADKEIPLLSEEEQREAFRRTMADYFRLVRVF